MSKRARKTGYYVVAKRDYWWKLLLGPFDSYADAWARRHDVTLPPDSTVDVMLQRTRRIIP